MHRPLLVLLSTALLAATNVRAEDTARPTLRVTSGDAAIVYSEPGFSGRSMTLAGEIERFPERWAIRSIRIQAGQWELCERERFEGRCAIVDGSTDDFHDGGLRVRSLRPVYDEGWKMIGRLDVRDDASEGLLPVWGHDRHRQIRLCAERHAVRFYDVEVRFLLGKQDVDVRPFIGPGRCSRDIDLDYGARDIALIKFRFEAANWGRDGASVLVFAR